MRTRAAIGGIYRVAARIGFSRPGDRELSRLEESPDTAGQDAGEIPGGESRRKVAQKGDRHRRNLNSGDVGGKGETVG